MSDNTQEQDLPNLFADTEGDKPPARKRAAKKSTVKKAAAKKVAARKVAKKVAKSAPEAAEAQSDVQPAPKKRASRAKKTEDVPAAVQESDREAAAPAPVEPVRFGRVPGGGPVAPREKSPDASASDSPAPTEEMEADPRPAPEGRQQGPQHRDGQQPMSRSKRRREKRKRRQQERQAQGHGGQQQPRGDGQGGERPSQQPTGPKIEADGMLELAPKGFGFLRVPGKNFEQARDDVFVTPESIRKYNLRLGQWIHGLYQEGPRGPQLVEITAINGMTPEEAAKLPHFDELKAVNPSKRISFETTPERFTTRVVDIMAPVGRGQRGLIVSPPRSGKTTLLLHMAEAIREKYEDTIHLMVLLVDERPEEVTEFRRALPGAEIYASSNDEQARNHCRIAELAIERAKRLVEAGKDVFLLMDSITRLARAYNNTMGMGGRGRGRATGSGGITIGAISLTIVSGGDVTTLTAADFTLPFVIIGILAIASVYFYMQLPPTAGDHLTTRKAAQPAAAEDG